MMAKKEPNPDFRAPSPVYIKRYKHRMEAEVICVARGVVTLAVKTKVGGPQYTFRLATGQPEKALDEAEWAVEPESLDKLREWYFETTGNLIQPRRITHRSRRPPEPRVDPRQTRIPGA